MRKIVNFMKLFSLRARIAFLSAGLMLVDGMSITNAQTNLAKDFIQDNTDTFKSLFADIIKFLQVATGIGAAVALVIIIVQIFKGERDSMSKVAQWGLGFIIAFASFYVLGNIIKSV